MNYLVILSKRGHVLHYWMYDSIDYSQALDQHKKLTEAFSEVNEAQVLILKVGPAYDLTEVYDLVQSIYDSLP